MTKEIFQQKAISLLTRSQASKITPGALFISSAAKPKRDFSFSKNIDTELKKTEELLTSTTKLTEVNELLESFKEVKNTQEQQINAMREENEKASIGKSKF